MSKPKAVIYIVDEVKCKILGLSYHDYKYLHDIMEVRDPAAYFSEKFKSKQWNGKWSFFSMEGLTYINLLDKIIEYINNKYTIEIEDHRKDYSFTFDEIDENYLSEYKWDENHRFANQPIILEEHQVRAINTLLKSKQGMIESCTGSGKTLITAALIKMVESYGRVIVIVPNISLVIQTAETLKLVGLDVGILYGGKKEVNSIVTVSTWQSIQSIEKKVKNHPSLTKEEIETLLYNQVALITDECHTAQASILMKILTTTFSYIPLRWGMTGTIPKEELKQVRMCCSLGEQLEQIQTKELQNKGFLASSYISVIQLYDTRLFSEYSDEVDYISSDRKRAKYYAKLTNSIKNVGNTLILVNRIDMGKKLQKELSDIGINSHFINGSIKSKHRQQYLEEIKKGDNVVLIGTYKTIATGIDIPRLQVLIMIELGKSYSTTLQSIGRGLRKANDKKDIVVVDICSTTPYSYKHSKKRVTYYKEANHKYDIKVIKDWE